MAEDLATSEKDSNELESEFSTRSKATASANTPPSQSLRRLTVGRADDPSERLADRMADSAVSQLRRNEHGPHQIRRQAANTRDPLGGTEVDADIQRTIDSRRGAGTPLRQREADHFSNSYGTDLSGVRLHTDSTADKLSRSLQANAFTTGSDIFFRKGTYQPGTSSGDRLIGHELAHVATEGGGSAPKRSIRRLLGFGGKKETPKPEKHSPKDNTTVFQKLGEMLGDHVENKGDAVEFSLEINIPVSGYSVGATLGVEAENEGDGVMAKVAIAITGGVSIPGVDLKAALGGYLEAKGKDGKMAGDLLGYSMYRRLAESNAVPAEVQAYMFGGGDKKKASENMAAIELAAFGDEDSEYYAESGGSVGVEAAIGGDEGVKVKGGGTMGTRTDRKSMEMAGVTAGGQKGKGGGLLNKGIGWATGGARGAEKAIGRATSGLSFSAEFSNPLEAELSYEAKWVEEDGGVTQLDSREFAVEITIPEKAAEKIKPLVDAIFHIVNTNEATAKGKTRKEKAQIWVQSQVDKAKEMATDKVKEAAMELEPVKEVADAAKAGLAKAGKALGVGYEDEEKMSVKLTVDLKELGVEVGITQSEEKKVTLPGIEASMKKSSTKSVGAGSKA